MPGRCASSSPSFRSRRRARRSCSRSMTAPRDPLAGRTIEEKRDDPQVHELPRLSHQVLRLQRRSGELLSGPHARFLRARMRRGAGRGRARSRLSRASTASGCRRGRGRGSPTSIISPTATPRSPGCWCARCCRMSRPATPWRRGAGAVRLRQARPRRAECRIRLDATCIDVRNAGDAVLVGYVRAGVTRTRRGEARGARLLPHDDPAHHAGTAGAAARRARSQRQDAARLHQRADPQLAAMGAAGRARHFRADVVSHPGEARFSRQSRRLSPSAATPPNRCACISSTFRARPTRGSMPGRSFASARGSSFEMTFADFEARIRDELDRMLGPGGFSSARDIAAITVNRWPHGYGYVANSLVRWRRLRERSGTGAAKSGRRCHRQFRRRRRRLCPSRDRPGGARGARAHGVNGAVVGCRRACRVCFVWSGRGGCNEAYWCCCDFDCFGHGTGIGRR